MASRELNVTITGDGDQFARLHPRGVATQALMDLARHSTDDLVRLNAALALLGKDVVNRG